MMRAIVKDFYSTDIDVPLSEFKPLIYDNFCFLARYCRHE